MKPFLMYLINNLARMNFSDDFIKLWETKKKVVKNLYKQTFL